jgi:hypothetical protein
MTDAAHGHGPAESPAHTGMRAGTLISILGAATSVALLAGAAWWGYRLAVLDVNGVPVLRAAQGPMRVAPAEPGGRVAQHVGLAVNSVVGTGSGALADRVVLAPPPTTLPSEDRIAAVAAHTPAPVADPEAAMEDAVARALSAVVTEDDPGDGLARSLRPRARPGSDQASLADLGLTGVQSVAARNVREIDPATLRPGTRLAQLGAFDDEASARAEWDRIAARAGALMEGKDRILQPATSAGRAFIRLRVAAFENEDEARRFCTAIESAMPGALRCVPVTHR